ncbi:hypothetical protein, partial [Desulfovibrio piger]|uniref:hypothetical protein n=1 Tax=Desulfovibrio piger TaxID=901 RepID=UPI0026F1DB12
HAKKLYQGMLPAEKAEEMTGVERDGDFSLRPKSSPPFKAPLFPFRKSCSGYQARRAAVDGAWCLAISGMHSMVWRAVPAGRLLARPVWRTPFGRHFCCRFPALRFFVLNEGRRVERAFP